MGKKNKSLPKTSDDEVEDWLLTYADMVTLLLCFFILLVAMAVFVDDEVDPFAIRTRHPTKSPVAGIGKKIGGKLNHFLHPFATDANGDFIKSKGMPRRLKRRMDYMYKKAEEEALFRSPLIDPNVEARDFTEIKAALLNIVTPDGKTNVVKIKETSDAFIITLKDRVFFDLGKADIKKRYQKVVASICGQIATIASTRIIVEGHTDSIPIKSPRYPSNWELGGARAAAVITACRGKIAVKKFLARSFADTVKDPETGAPSRRVNVRVIKANQQATGKSKKEINGG